MADKKISELTELAVQPADNDLLVVVDVSAGETKKLQKSNLFTGSAGQVLRIPSAGGAASFDDMCMRRNEIFFCDDFLSNNSPMGNQNWQSNVSGGSLSHGVGLATNPGVISLLTGTAATDRAGIRLGTQSLLFGGGAMFLEWLVRVETLATVTDDYILRVGFGDNITSDFADGAYFEYDRATSGNFWRTRTASSSTRTTTVLGTAISASTTTFVRLGILVNAAGTQVNFFINGVDTGTAHTTNIPNVTGRETAINYNYLKTAGTATITVSSADYCYFNQILTTAR